MNYRSLFFLAASLQLAFGQEEVCTGFGSGPVGADYIRAHFSSAVLRIQDVGTAYLIDAARGYLLTAGHVLDDLAHKHEPLEVVLGQSPSDSRLAFTVVKRSAISDVALLQLTPTDALKDVQALDISFALPGYSDNLFVMGYPQYGPQGQIFLRSGAAKVQAYPPSGLLEVTHNTDGGSSGGPLLDSFGDVVATAEEELEQNQVGLYLPIYPAFEDILQDIPISARMQQIEKTLILATTSEAQRRQLLNKGNPQGPTNLELYLWLHSLSKSPQELNAISQDLFRCPLMPALVERHMAYAIVPFLTTLRSSQIGEVKLALAEREYTLGHNAAAAALTRDSLAALTPAPSAAAVPNPPSASPLRQKALLLGWAIEQQQQIAGETVRQDVVPVSLTLDTGSVERYLVHWIGTVEPTRSESGHPSEPLKGWLTDTRQCHWNIRSEILRKVYSVDSKGQVSTEDAVTKILSVGFGNRGSAFVLTQLRGENCGDAAAKYMSDVNNAKSAVANKFTSSVAGDRELLVQELRRLPHVTNVTLKPVEPR